MQDSDSDSRLVSLVEKSERASGAQKAGVCRDFQRIWLELRGAGSMDEIIINRSDQPDPMTGWVQPE